LDFARLLGAQAEVAYVLPIDEYAPAGAEGVRAGRESARRDLLGLKAKLRREVTYNDQTECRVTLLEGCAAECLLDCARQKKIDLIVVGTHGRGGVGKMLLGSVAEKVFRHSSVPVLTIGPNVNHHKGLLELRHILAPCDLSPRTHPAMNCACALAAAHNSWLAVLNVANREAEGPKVDLERLRAGIRGNLAEIVGERGHELNIHYSVEFGDVASLIVNAASHDDTDLIVLGVRPSYGMLDRFMWPIAYEVVRRATCPVLTIRGSSSRA
jgi:nucleotide-binding universal stress UspA family protein